MAIKRRYKYDKNGLLHNRNVFCAAQAREAGGHRRCYQYSDKCRFDDLIFFLIINLHHHCHCPNTKESSLSTNLLKSGLNCSFKGEDMISPTGLRAWRIMYRSTFEETEHLYICRRLCYKNFTHLKIRVLTMKALARKDGRIF